MNRVMFILVTTLLATPAVAESPDWNFVQGAYQNADIDVAGFDVDGDGLGISGSFEIAELVHLFAGYQTFDFDFGVDLDQLAVGVGWHPGMTDTTDLVFEVAYLSAEASAAGFSDDEDGYGVTLGLRSMVQDNLELAGGINYVDVGDDDTSIDLQGWYTFTNALAVGAGVEFGDDATILGIGLRWYFMP